jgi:hypothetical protein
MTMPYLQLAPHESNYSTSEMAEVRRFEAIAGKPKYRKIVAYAASRVQVQWKLGQDRTNQLLAFMRLYGEPTLPFEVDLVLDGEFGKYAARLIPNSLRVSDVIGTARTVGAELSVLPRQYPPEYDEALVTLFEAYGSVGYEALAALEHLVEEDFIS